MAGEVECAGELARALPTRVAASMHNLGSMSLEVDLSTRGAPCSCSADVSRKSPRAKLLCTLVLELYGSMLLKLLGHTQAQVWSVPGRVSL